MLACLCSFWQHSNILIRSHAREEVIWVQFLSGKADSRDNLNDFVVYDTVRAFQPFEGSQSILFGGVVEGLSKNVQVVPHHLQSLDVFVEVFMFKIHDKTLKPLTPRVRVSRPAFQFFNCFLMFRVCRNLRQEHLCITACRQVFRMVWWHCNRVLCGEAQRTVEEAWIPKLKGTGQHVFDHRG